MPPTDMDAEHERERAEWRFRTSAWLWFNASDGHGCSRCGSDAVIPWLYGEPTPEAAEAGERGELMIGGNVVLPDRPRWHCKGCGKDWGRIGGG